MVKEQKSSVPVFIVGILACVVGCLVLMYKQLFITIVTIAIGCAVFAEGVYTLFHIRKWRFEGVAGKFAVIKSIILILVGICAIFLPLAFALETVAVFCYIFASCLTASAFFTIQNGWAYRVMTGESAFPFIAEAFFDVLFAVVLALNPQPFMYSAVVVIGVTAIVCGACLLGWGVCLARINSKQKI